MTILPGQCIGIVGGGQLGRMLALAARRMGYRTAVLDPDGEGPAAQVCDFAFAAAYDDAEAIEALGRVADVVTVEFENVPALTLEKLGECVPVRPNWHAVHVAQNREREKTWLAANGIPCPAFAIAESPDELREAVGRIGLPSVAKTAAFGYDGKGQMKFESAPDDWDAAWERLGAPRVIVEAWIPFEREISVVGARTIDGRFAAFDPAENLHAHHILDVSIAPARIPEATRVEALALAERIADALNYVGVLGVEMFVTGSGELMVNELAPRTHNSGHHTIDACVVSQFEQQVRAVCGLPLGDPRLLSPVAMVNLLGDTWIDAGGAPDWPALLAADSSVRLHLYGKAEPRRKRKMGHFTVLADSAEAALAKAASLKRMPIDG